MKKYPLVLISFQDHSVHVEGTSEPVMFLAHGILLKEDKMGYTLGHWLKDGNEGEITTYVAKVKGLKKKTIGHLKLKM